MRTRTWLCSLFIIAATAQAEVKQAAPTGFLSEHVVELAVPPARAFAALGQIDRWWDPGHTWSGSAANLSLKPEAGGCFCEKWKGGSVEHGRVVMAQKDKVLRLAAALGPLQDLAVNGALTFAVSAKGSGSTLTLTYKVSGDGGLDKLAPLVDRVLGEQVARLERYLESGKPDPKP